MIVSASLPVQYAYVTEHRIKGPSALSLPVPGFGTRDANVFLLLRPACSASRCLREIDIAISVPSPSDRLFGKCIVAVRIAKTSI